MTEKNLSEMATSMPLDKILLYLLMEKTESPVEEQWFSEYTLAAHDNS